MGVGCIAASPDTFILPQPYSCGPVATQNEAVPPAATWRADAAQRGAVKRGRQPACGWRAAHAAPAPTHHAVRQRQQAASERLHLARRHLVLLHLQGGPQRQGAGQGTPQQAAGSTRQRTASERPLVQTHVRQLRLGSSAMSVL